MVERLSILILERVPAYVYYSKMCLITINFILFVLSIILITGGSFKLDTASPLPAILKNYISIPSYLMMTFGAILLCISLLAFLCLRYRSRTLFSVYKVILALTIALQLSICVYSSMLRSNALDLLINYLQLSSLRCNKDSQTLANWNWIQKDLKCCGLKHYTEWFNYFQSLSVPDSCCKIYSVDCGTLAVQNGNIYKTGCQNSVHRWASDHEFLIRVTFTLIGFFETISFPIIAEYQRILS